MSKPRAIDLFCGAGGVSVGLARAGFEVVGVDIRPMPHYRGGTFVQADALTYPLDGFDFIWASPPCQAYSSATRITGRQADHPDLIAPVRDRLEASGTPYAIENVPGAPLGGQGRHPLVLLCGTMFGLQTPDGRAEIRRHRWFELSWPVLFRPQCQHGGESLSVVGHEATVWSADRRTLSVVGKKGLPGLSHERRQERRRVLCVAGGKAMSGGTAEPQGSRKRRAISVTGNTPQTNLVTNQLREIFSVEDARAAMGIDWMPMKHLSQAIPPAYAEWIGRQALNNLKPEAR